MQVGAKRAEQEGHLRSSVFLKNFIAFALLASIVWHQAARGTGTQQMLEDCRQHK